MAIVARVAMDCDLGVRPRVLAGPCLSSGVMSISLTEKRALLAEHGDEIRDNLRDSLHDAGVRFAGRVLDYVQRHPERVRRAADFHAIDEASNGKHLAIPPDIHVALRGPFRPPPADRIDVVVAVYEEFNAIRGGVESPGAHYRERISREDLRAALSSAGAVDRAVWAEYVRVHRRQQDRARHRRGLCTLLQNAGAYADQGNRAFTNVHGLLDVPNLRHYDTFLLAANSAGSQFVSPMRVPVGDYGVRFARRMMRSANFLVDFAQQDQELLLDIAALVPPHRATVMERTLRARDGFGPEVGHVRAIQEGVQSIFSKLIMHMAEPIRRFETDPMGAFTAVCAADLPNITTMHSGLAVAGPMLLHGVTLPHPNEWSPRGKLVLREGCRDQLHGLQEKSVDIEFAALQEYLAKRAAGDAAAHAPVRTGLWCPFAGGFRDDNGTFVDGLISHLTQMLPVVMAAVGDEPSDGHGMPWEAPDFMLDTGAPPRLSLLQRAERLVDTGVIPPWTAVAR